MSGDRGQPLRAEPLSIRPGAVVGDKYVVERVLGSGSMGFVVLARHKLIGQRVAIKFIKPAHVGSAEALARFDREARALVAVKSENVVRVFDYGTLPDDSPYLVMEYLTGRDLAKELAARGALPLGDAAEILAQACEGLAAAHARGIVHRDIKPANLLLTARGTGTGRLLVKIVDFGVSKAPMDAEDALTLTQHAVGSPHYMSPEQLRNAPTVSARSDVWSLGVTLFRTLSGELPFAGGSMGELTAAILTGAPRRLRDLRPELPEEVGEIVARCLHKDPAERYSSAHDLADALAPFALPFALPLLPDAAPDSEPVLPIERPRTPAGAFQDSTARAHVVAPTHEGSLPPERRPQLALAAAIGLPLALALAVMVAVLGRAPDGGVGRDAATPLASSPSRTIGTALTEVPLPRSNVAAAQVAYQAGLQAIRDASFVVAVNSFERAAALDPTMAAAELRTAVYGDWVIGGETRQHLRTAIALRGSLSPRDQALLEAATPLYLPPRPDIDEGRRRLDALVSSHPGDAELGVVSALLLANRRPHGEERALVDAALVADPKFAGAIWMRAVLEALSGQPAAALGSVGDCLAVSPAAASCLRVRAMIEDMGEGDCAGLEADAERMVAMEEDSYRAHDFRALALVARGRPLEAVRDALRRKWRASPERSRRMTELVDEAHLAMVSGDFAGAVKDALALESVGAASGTEAERRAGALLLLELHGEMGEPVLAAEVADHYLQRAAWGSAAVLDEDPRPLLYAVAVRGGKRTLAERDEALGEWLADWTPRVLPLERGSLWIAGFAAPAESRAEAEIALARLPEYQPLAKMTLAGWTAPATAKVAALAGHEEDALADLQLVTSSCHLLADPVTVTRASLALGQALEARGDARGACDAYRTVIRRWGTAKRSVTAAAARGRFAALACSP